MSWRYVRRLDDLADLPIDRVGGKAASLGVLAGAGFRVPLGFCLLADAHRDSRGGMALEVRRELLAAFAELQRGAPSPIAVRSSATAEDLADASFAGVYETVLGVVTADELLDAVARCWSSVNSARAAEYRRDRSSDEPVHMAVVVQRLLAPRAAGALFTTHPVTGNLEQAVVSSSWGLGEAVVSSLVDPDTWIVRKQPFEVLDERLGRKEMALSAVGRHPIPAAEQLTPSLDRNQLASLTQLAIQVEELFHFPQDVEWAVADGEVHVLQSRRITTVQDAYYDAQLHLWARLRGLDPDAGTTWKRGSELSSLRVSPLYFSEMAAYFTDFYADLAHRDGQRQSGVQRWRYHAGWVYSNTRHRLQGRRVPRRVLDVEWLPRIKVQLRHWRTRSYWSCDTHYYRLRDNVWLRSIDEARPDLDHASPAQIEAFIELIETIRRGARSTLASTGIDHAACLLSLLRILLRSWAGDDDRSTLADCTSGLDGLETHDENVAVWEVAQHALRSPEVMVALQDGEYGRLPDVSGGPAFLDAAEALRATYGHRGASDRDLARARWDDELRLVLDQVRVVARSDASEAPAATSARAITRREAAVTRTETMIRARTPRTAPVRIAVFREVLRLAQRYWVFRDNQRHEFDRYFLDLRRAYLTIGRRLAAREILDDAVEIFFLSKEEVLAAAADRLPAAEVRRRASWRRNRWTTQADEEAPDVLGGDLPAVSNATSGTVLQGVGGSAGRVTARVRVVTDIGGLVDVEHGEILVTHAIDPAWTRVFPILGGIVSEEGGMLSHATVLAREYGVPAVIGVGHATRRLRTGQVVAVDGTAGRLDIVDTADERAGVAPA